MANSIREDVIERGGARRAGAVRHLTKLYEYRELLLTFAWRDIKVRYKQSFLGAAWAILQPFSLMVIFTIIFSIFAKLPSDGIPYPIFSYCALLPWTFLSTSLTTGVPCFVANMSLITKIYFPREIFPIAKVFAAFVDFLVASIIFVGMMIYYHVPLSIHLVWIPVLIVIQIFLSLGILFFAATINVFYRDVNHVVPLVTRIWMYLTPIIYPVSLVPERFRSIYMLNPMAGIIDSYRRIILHGKPPNITYLSYALVISFSLLVISYIFFKKKEMVFADVI